MELELQLWLVLNLLKNTGVPEKNIIMLDSKGVLYRGRDNLNQWKSAHAIETKKKNSR